jgi:hypothetical protein
VIDVTWKKAFTSPIRRSITNTDPASSNNYQAVGTRGDTIAVHISIYNNPYNQGALRIANEITVKGSSTVSQVDKLKVGTCYPFFPIIIDYSLPLPAP